jgi:hypothetical protein
VIIPSNSDSRIFQSPEPEALLNIERDHFQAYHLRWKETAFRPDREVTQRLDISVLACGI